MQHRLLSATLLLTLAVVVRAEPLPDTQPLTRQGDIAAQLVAGIDKYLMREIAASIEKRKLLWKPDFSSAAAHAKSVQPNRDRLRKILGVVETRVAPVKMELLATTETPALVAETEKYRVFLVRWPVLPGVDGEGLLVEPKGEVKASVIALPDAAWTPEQYLGLMPGAPALEQRARLIASTGCCRIVVPMLIDRGDEWSGNPRLRMTNQPHREFIYRAAYEMGWHIIGCEVQKVLAAVDWLTTTSKLPVTVVGTGEGGLLALHAAALDPRIANVEVRGYFGPREGVWSEPIYRNVWTQLKEFGDAEMTALIAPRRLHVVPCAAPEVSGPPRVRPGRAGGAAPGVIVTPKREAVAAEFRRAQTLLAGLDKQALPTLGDGLPPDAERFYGNAFEEQKVAPAVELQSWPVPERRQQRQVEQLIEYTQRVMRDAERVRNETFWAKLNPASLEQYDATTRPFRKQLEEEILGKLPDPTEPMTPRTRALHDTPMWRSYEVTLELYPDVFAYGILTVPKDLKPGEKRPVVVCQHGLEGRPTDVINPKEITKYYNSFGSRLADKGYVVFAPQNCYIGKDDFRVLQRKANPLGLSLFSFINRQHERILAWLETLPFVDGERMGFYGLSYGGKTAMRVPAVITKYRCSICSGDFNEWTWKNVSIDFRGSYMFTGEYEMPEFNMGNTLVYAEMAALIAPRPFMVERGHDDGVGIDEWINYEYAKVRRLYSRLKLSDRTEIEHQPGGHECFCKGTFAFLAKHLNWRD